MNRKTMDTNCYIKEVRLDGRVKRAARRISEAEEMATTMSVPIFTTTTPVDASSSSIYFLSIKSFFVNFILNVFMNIVLFSCNLGMM